VNEVEIIVFCAISAIFGSVIGFAWTHYMPAPYDFGLLLPVAILAGLIMFFVTRWYQKRIRKIREREEIS
jgi:uncharacterized membrane protein YfcA